MGENICKSYIQQGFDMPNTLEKEMATHSSILAWEIPRQRSRLGYTPWGRKESDTTEGLNNNSNNTGYIKHSERSAIQNQIM